MRDRWFWMSGESMKFTKWPRDSVPNRYSNPCGGMARGERFLWEDQPCEELLNFICESGRGYTSHPACCISHQFPSPALPVP